MKLSANRLMGWVALAVWAPALMLGMGAVAQAQEAATPVADQPAAAVTAPEAATPEASVPADTATATAVIATDAPAPGIEAAAEAKLDKQPAEITAYERARRQEQEIMGDGLVVKAAKFYREGKYKEAIEQYTESKTYFEKASKSEKRVTDKIARADQAVTDVTLDWAESLAADGKKLADAQKYDDAVKKCQEVAERDPSRKAEMDVLVKEYQNDKKTAQFRADVAPGNVDPTKVERDYDVNVLFEQGKVFYAHKRYMEARDAFERILVKDPYDSRAIRYLRKINDNLFDVGTQRLDTTQEERMAEVRWKWNEPITPITANPNKDIGGLAVKKGDAERGIRAKLQNIILPKVEFEEASVAQVVAFLKKRSQELDPDGEGVNIILQLEAPPAAADAGADENAGEGDTAGGDTFNAAPTPPAGGMPPGMMMPPNAAPAPAGGEEAVAMAPPAAGGPTNNPGERTVTLSMTNVPMGEVIRYLCMGTGLKYVVDTNAVVIADKSVPLKDLETRFYSVEAGVIDSAKTRKAKSIKGKDGDTEEEDTGAEAGTGGGIATDAASLQKFFRDFGVDFPTGSRVAYNQRTSKLIVHNTPENLVKIEKVLQEINVTPTQVTIEAKFVEVNQQNMEALGFNWLLGTYNPTNYFLDKGSDKNAFKIFKQIPGGAYPFNTELSNGLRGFGDALKTSGGALFAPTAGNILNVDGVIGNTEFQVLISALSQSAQADLLSAPKVTALSGSTAILRMVEERYFPESWEQPDITTTGGDTPTTAVKPSSPTFGEARDVGVVLEVTPTVAADGYSIDLELKPQVTIFKGYDTTFNSSIQPPGYADPVEFKYDMPIIEARTVETKVIVWDGETVVLGGLIREDLIKFSDKVPFLGDIPVIGRLFRSEGENSIKKNLLIFVTARLVSPSGVPIRASDVRGLPDFRR
jgi:general secretion pathway protein D